MSWWPYIQDGPDSIRQFLIINNQSIQQHMGKWESTFAIYRQQKVLSHLPVCCWIDWLLMIKNCLIESGPPCIYIWRHVLWFCVCVCRIPLYLQSLLIHSENAVRSYTRACRRVITSTLLYLIGSESSCDLGNVTYKLNFVNFIYNYNFYMRGIEFGRQVYWKVSSKVPCFWWLLKV
jgi:hypothetical protein